MGTGDTPMDWGKNYRKDQISANSFMQRHPAKPISKPCDYRPELRSAQVGRKPVAEVCQSREGVLQCLKPATLPLHTEINLLLRQPGKAEVLFVILGPYPGGRRRGVKVLLVPMSYIHTQTCAFSLQGNTDYVFPVRGDGTRTLI